jgi:hypothetical protein
VPGAAEYYSAALKLSRKTGVQYVIALHRLSDLSATGDVGSRVQQLDRPLIDAVDVRTSLPSVLDDPMPIDDEGLSLLGAVGVEPRRRKRMLQPNRARQTGKRSRTF